MTKRKKRKQRKRSKQRRHKPGVDPRTLRIVRRELGGRRPDRSKVFQALLREARRTLDSKSEYQVALGLVKQASQLARSDDERQACDSLVAEVYFARALNSAGQARMDDLEKSVKLAPRNTRYRVHLAHALQQKGKVGKAITRYQAADEASREMRVGYLWCVAALEAGRPLPAVDLTPAEKNTLDVVQHLLSGNLKAARQIGPVLDGSPPVWRALTQMLADETATPIEDLKTAITTLNGTQAGGMTHYYRGVASLRAGDLDTAWQALADARQCGYTSPWLEKNLGFLARARAIQRAEAGDWQGVINAGEPMLRTKDDHILAETVGLAHFHLGYEAAQSGDWATAARHWQAAWPYIGSRHLAQNLALALEQQEDWEGAAEAWRDMIRRRPRKKEHPDYLDDNRVAGLWRHAAECYIRAGNPAEAVACLRNALRYTPDDIEMRREFSQALMDNEQFDAAENELNRILEKEPEDIETLVRLSQLYDTANRWRSNSMVPKLLERALELDPDHQEAREVLALHYIKQGRQYVEWGMYGQAAEQYRHGLEHLPDYTLLYVNLARVERRLGHEDEAREYVLQAYEAEPDRTRTVGPVLHELLHLNAGEDIQRLMPRIREMPGVLPGFWTNHGEPVLKCQLGPEWAEQFCDDAIALVQQPWVHETRAEILVDIVIALSGIEEGPGHLERMYRKRIEREASRSGAKEFLDGLMAVLKEYNWDKAERLLGKARHKARKAGEKGLVEKIEAAQEFVFAGDSDVFDLLDKVVG